MYYKPTIVISAYPACGKSYMYKNFNGKSYTMLDSDSSLYSWIYENGVKTNKRNPNFIQDYIAHIKENIGKIDVIFVSSHKEARQALRDNGIKYFMVYPSLDMKEEMLRRMRERGNDEKFIQFQDEHYEKFVTDIIKEHKKVYKNLEFNGQYPPFYVELNAQDAYINPQMIARFFDDWSGSPFPAW